MRHFRIRNHERFQHYRNRNPPWIMLHLRLFGSQRFLELTDTQKWHALALALIASRYENHLPDNPKWLKEETHSQQPIDLDPLIEAKFIVWCSCEECASNLQQVAADCSGLLLRGEESIVEKNPPLPPRRGVVWKIQNFQIPDGIGPAGTAALQDWLDYRKEARRRPYRGNRWITNAWNRCRQNEPRLVEAVTHSIAVEWDSINPAPGSRFNNDVKRVLEVGENTYRQTTQPNDPAKLAELERRRQEIEKDL